MDETRAPSEALVGHGWVPDLISRSIEAGRLSHAYLLAGLPHIGKLTTAVATARLLLCAEGTACGVCRHCRLVSLFSHPDLRVLEIPPHRRNIPVRDVHDFLHGIALRPLEAERK